MSAQPWKTAPENTWWSVTSKGFTNSLALALPGGQFAVLNAAGTTTPVAASTITSATKMAVVDDEWVQRSQSQGTDINDAQRRIAEVQSVCQGWLSRAQPHPPEVTELINAIAGIVADSAEVSR